MRYSKIINETVDRYLAKIIKEDTEAQKSYETEYGENLSQDDEAYIRSILQRKEINLSAIAQRCFPDHTEEGAQSQLRKAVWGEKSDSNSEYHIKAKVGATILRVLDEMGIS